MSDETAQTRGVADPDLGLARTGGVTADRGQLVAERSTAQLPPGDPFAEALARIKVIAHLTRGGALLQWSHSVLDPIRDHTFMSHLRQAYESFGLIPPVSRPMKRGETVAAYQAAVLEPRTRQIVAAFRADLGRVMAAVQEAAGPWVVGATAKNHAVREKIQAELLHPDTVARLHAVARQFIDEYHHQTLGLKPGERIALVKGIEERLASKIDDPAAKLLFTQPDRIDLFRDLATSRNQAEAAIARVLDKARKGIDDFAKEMRAQPDHRWRYAPIIVGTCQVLEMADDAHVLNFLLRVARARSAGSLGFWLFVAGTAVMAAALVASGPAALLALGLVDFALAGFETYTIVLREWENDLATAAGVLGKGQQLTDRPSEYGPAYLTGAAALLSAAMLPSLLRAFREAQAARQAAKASQEFGASVEQATLQEGKQATNRGTSDKGVTERGAAGDQAVEQAALQEGKQATNRGTSDKGVTERKAVDDQASARNEPPPQPPKARKKPSSARKIPKKPRRSPQELWDLLQRAGLTEEEILAFRGAGATGLGPASAGRIERLLENFSIVDIKALAAQLVKVQRGKPNFVLTDAMVDALIEAVPAGELAAAIRSKRVPLESADATPSPEWQADAEALAETTTEQAGKTSLRELGETSGSRILGANMDAAKRPRPAEGYQAHHVIPEKEFGEGMDWARERLADALGTSAGRAVHEADNGAWLISSGSAARGPKVPANPELSVLHQSYVHAGTRKEYAYTLTKRLADKHNQEFLKEVRKIGKEMEEGEFRIKEIPHGWKTKWEPGMKIPDEGAKLPDWIDTGGADIVF